MCGWMDVCRRNNVLHGLVDNGRSTQFPQAIGMAASFDAEQLRLAARVMSNEQRAKHNTQNQVSACYQQPAGVHWRRYRWQKTRTAHWKKSSGPLWGRDALADSSTSSSWLLCMRTSD